MSSSIAPSRYMTQDLKRSELRVWEELKKTPVPDEFVGGMGYPDREIFAHVDRLNRLHRLCTLQSCAGHKCTPERHCEGCSDWATFSAGGSGEHMWNGQLWLWPDEKLGWWFLQHAPELALLAPRIDKVSVLWHVEQREIIDIQFQGAGHGQLENSMNNICAFFERGNMECNLQ